MYKKIFTEGYVLAEKGKLDSYNPTYFESSNYKNWISELLDTTCLFCRGHHGKVYDIDELPNPCPPVHERCKCKLVTLRAIEAGNATANGINGADYYLKYNGELPDYYINDEELSELGWRPGKRISSFAPGKMYTKGVYDNSDKHLPDREGRIWYEADINYTPGKRNKHRVLWSNDGLIFVTYDHYITFYEIV